MENHYDIIVAGGGLAGNLAAAAAAKRGMKVLLLDKNKPEESGKKTNWGWVCGDAVATQHLKFITDHLGIKFGEPELDCKVEGVIAYSPDMESKFVFDGEGYILDRPDFERKLREHAIKNGAQVMTQFDVEGPIIENDFVVGVSGKDHAMVHKEFRAKVVIDCLGVATNLRRKLPDNKFVDKVVDIDDLESTGRYIYDMEVTHEDLKYYDPKNALIHLNQVLAPGGYGWVFPKKGNGRVNIGIGTQKSSIEIRNQKLGKKDSLHTLMDQYVEWVPNLKKPKIYDKDKNGKGYWSVAVRRQLECLVYNGYMGAGDSMAMPNPISAGGIGPALIAGVLAGEDAADAIKAGDVSMKGLWKYNLDFNKAYGSKTAGMEVFRIYMQSLNNEQLNYGMKNFLTEREAQDISYGRPASLNLEGSAKLGLKQKMAMLVKGAMNITAFTNLVWAVNKMKKLNALYEKYPENPDVFLPWKQQVQHEIEETKARFKPSPI